NVPTLAECLQGLRDTRVQDRRLRLERQIVFTISTTKNLDHLRIRYIRVQRSDRLRHRQPDDAPYPRLVPPGQTTDIRRHANGFDDASDGVDQSSIPVENQNLIVTQRASPVSATRPHRPAPRDSVRHHPATAPSTHRHAG